MNSEPQDASKDSSLSCLMLSTTPLEQENAFPHVVDSRGYNGPEAAPVTTRRKAASLNELDGFQYFPAPSMRPFWSDTASRRNDDTPSASRIRGTRRNIPIHKYSSDLELMLAFRRVVEAHESLYGQGILHRDISSGNVIIVRSIPLPLGDEGLLIDLEYSHNNKATRTVEHKDTTTDTTQFMAAELLAHSIVGDEVPGEPHHDLESILLVLGYAVMKHTDQLVKMDLRLPGAAKTEERDAWSALSRSTWGRSSLRGILESRRSNTALTFHAQDEARKGGKIARLIGLYISPEMQNVLDDAAALNYQQNITTYAPRANPTHVTYDAMLNLFDTAINRMRAVAAS